MPLAKRKRILRRRILFLILFIFLAIAGWLFYQWWEFERVKFVRYPEFGIAIPAGYSIHGIDVSRYQQNISWEEVRAMQVKNIRLGFAFIKASEGIGNTDKQFQRNWKRSKQSGMIRGAYHFSLHQRMEECKPKILLKK